MRGNFRDAAGLSDAAFAAGILDVGGDCRANVTGIPSVITLPNIVARILAFTGAGGDNFYYTTGLDGAPQMQVTDNSASSFVVDFSDTALLAGISADSLFQLVELGECAGVIGYADRLFWWGERNKQNNWDNLTFDGGFDAANTVPLGWTADATYFAGGWRDSTGKPIWGGAYSILGDGVTPTRGLITQSAVTDYNGAPRLQANTAYSARVRVRMTGALTQGTVARSSLQRVASSFRPRALPCPLRKSPRARGPNSSRRSLHRAGSTDDPAGPAAARVCRRHADQRRGISGREHRDFSHGRAVQHVAGARVVCRRPGELRRRQRLHERLRKRRANGARGVPAARESLSGEGPLDLRHLGRRRERAGVVDHQRSLGHGGHAFGAGVDTGEDWAVIAGRAGMYIFDGGEPVKISQEIQPLWDQINWAAGQTLWVRVDTRNKRILCGVPIGTATSPNRILVLDYRSLSDAGEIESLGSVLFSTHVRKTVRGGPLAQVVPVEYHGELPARWPSAPTAPRKCFWATEA